MPVLETSSVLLVLWSLWLFQAAWCVFNVWAFRRRFHRFERGYQRRVRRDGPYSPATLLIVPVKGAGKNLDSTVSALMGQDFPNYRLQFVVESREDPAYAALARHGCNVLLAGLSERGGQKLHNMLAALDTVRPSDEVVAFADADGVPAGHWLRRLVEPLRNRKTGATTAYRWFVPGPGLASATQATLNASVATLLGSDWRTLAWGGSMAIRREIVDEIQLREFWRGALSDDYCLSEAVRKAGKKLSFVPVCMVASPVTTTWSRLWEFGRRQYLITRLYLPWAWWLGLFATGLYTASFASVIGVLVSGGDSALAAGSLFAVVVLDAVRGMCRIGVERLILPAEFQHGSRAANWMEMFLTPFWMGLHCLIIASSALGRRLRWAGITYSLRKRRDVRIVARS